MSMTRPGHVHRWPHLQDGDLLTPDARTAHAGMPVTAGTKVGVNLHAHRNNMRTRVLAGCAAGASGLSHVFDKREPSRNLLGTS